MKTLVPFCCACVLAIGTAVATTAAPPSARLDGFLKTIGRPSGLPDKALTRRMAPFVSRGLIAALARAGGEQARCMKQFPGDKPPWIEGNLFNSATFETPSGYKINAAKPDGSNRQVLSVTFVDADGRAPAWTDEYVMVFEHGHWRVDDVVFGGPFEFGPGAGSRLKPDLLAPGC